MRGLSSCMRREACNCFIVSGSVARRTRMVKVMMASPKLLNSRCSISSSPFIIGSTSSLSHRISTDVIPCWRVPSVGAGVLLELDLGDGFGRDIEPVDGAVAARVLGQHVDAIVRFHKVGVQVTAPGGGIGVFGAGVGERVRI